MQEHLAHRCYAGNVQVFYRSPPLFSFSGQSLGHAAGGQRILTGDNSNIRSPPTNDLTAFDLTHLFLEHARAVSADAPNDVPAYGDSGAFVRLCAHASRKRSSHDAVDRVREKDDTAHVAQGV